MANSERPIGDMAGPAPGEAAPLRGEAAPVRGEAGPVRGEGSAHWPVTRAHGDAPMTERDHEAVRRFIEDFASALNEMGVPRMPARVFVALLTSDSGRLTAAELGGQLGASAAAMSGAVRYLLQVGLIRREGEPGSRRHYYRVPDDVWDELITIRNRAMARWTAVLREGVPILGADTPAGARIAESVRYFEFVSAELPLVITRWRERKAALDGQAVRDR
jgi:predicted transcriptional regulator